MLFQLYSKTLCIKASAKLSRMVSICIVFKSHFTKLSYRLDVFFISSGILRNVWEIFSRATSSSWMCRIIVVLFELSLHVTDLSSYFKTSHKEPVDSVRTMLKLASPKCWDKNSWPQRSKFSSLPCSWLVTKGHSVSSAVRPSLSQNVECFQVFNAVFNTPVSSIYHWSHGCLSHRHVYPSALWWPRDLRRQ